MCRCRLCSGHVLINLLRGHRARILQCASARRVSLGLGERGSGFGNGGGVGLLREIGAHSVRRELRERLPALHIITHASSHVSEAKAVRFSSNDGFLPRRDVAVGRKPDRPIGLRCFGGGDG